MIRRSLLGLSLASLVTVVACSSPPPLAPSPTATQMMNNERQAPNDNACWGQATRVFAQTGEMGAHASAQETPRVGLRNLARALYEAGVIDEDTLQALGAFVAAELGLSIDACM